MENYIGNELDLFENATKWKRYYSKIFEKFIVGNIVEVGAGMGGTTSFLQNNSVQSWICLEPDNHLCSLIKIKISEEKISNTTIVINDTLKSINTKKDSIIYIDVIEHIENDKEELFQAFNLLNENGTLLIIVPAFNFLYNDFDKAIGHYRRYNKKSIRSIIPENSKIERIHYLDSAGFFTSLLNKYFLKQKYPKLQQILFWDKVLIPLSKYILDPLFNYSFGKSLLVVLKKQDK